MSATDEPSPDDLAAVRDAGDFDAPTPEPQKAVPVAWKPVTAAKSYLPDIHRLLPQSSDAEKGVICSILLSPDYAFEKCDDCAITADSFHIPAHSTIFRTLSAMHGERKAIDIVTLTGRLRDDRILDQVGGPAFITDLFTYLPTAANCSFYAAIIEEKATLRNVISVCTEHAARAYEEQDEVTKLVDDLETRVLAITGARYQGDAGGIVEVPAREGVMQAIGAIEALYERKGRISGLSSGFKQLDLLTDGWKAGEFIVIGARPSMGKTALLMDFAVSAVLESGARVIVFSCEMSAAQLYQRALCALAGVNMRSVRDGMLAERDFPALTAAASRLAASRLVVLDAVGATIGALRARARRLHRKEPVSLIVVDYLQKIRHPPSAKFREREIAEVSEGLKNIARELKVPLITAAQINRSPDARSGSERGVPRLSDLRESGSIEQDADVVGMLHRPEVYVKDEDEKKGLEGIANLEIVKQRSGPLGDVPLTFLKAWTRFETRAHIDAAEPQKRRWNDS